MYGMTQSSYVEKVLKRFKMKNSKRGFLPMRHGIKLFKKLFPNNDEELKRMLDVPYALAVGNIQYAFGLWWWRVDTRGYNDASFQSNEDGAESQFRCAFKLNGGVVA
ncbi:UNVERIFIED_CONTAM: hypothetical protein Sradi_2338500 [Sesamum radiatum]|uniref:Uncharacterized protein n=1 Tax=Sesamum radiatum TaxID=300843 RepID=A0AAW2T6I7_SESRA